MKILHVEAGKHFYGGPRQVAYIMEGLEQHGVTNVLACPVGAEIASGVAKSVRVHQMPMGGDLDLQLPFRLAALIRSERPDVVYLHSRRGADIWGGLAARMTNTPCVLSRRVDNPEARWQVALKYKLYDHVIAISQGIRNVLISEGVVPEKITCVRDAVDAQPYLVNVDRSAFLREFGLPPSAIVIGMVAQMIPRKGHRYLIEAVAMLQEEFPEVRVLLFGKGPLEEDIKKDIAQRGLSNIVRIAGFRTDLPKWLGGLDILAHPADMEGLGVSLLEASAAAVPIVTTRVGGLPEAVLNDVTGILVKPGSVSELASALRRLLDDAELRRRMGEAGRQRIVRDFSVNELVEKNLAVCEHVLSAKHKR